ncbi:MAG: hypothetical protein HC936_15690 [Leptolyngbyaceae cyanobacterium SU_3_3]|nr:hypothetical protein [Leptolyngbyaceae cyanobacterium SU_3_3]
MAMTSSPALAQKKKKDKEAEAAAAAAPAISPSKDYLPEARKVQAAYVAKDAVALEAALAAADAFATFCNFNIKLVNKGIAPTANHAITQRAAHAAPALSAILSKALSKAILL